MYQPGLLYFSFLASSNSLSASKFSGSLPLNFCKFWNAAIACFFHSLYPAIDIFRFWSILHILYSNSINYIYITIIHYMSQHLFLLHIILYLKVISFEKKIIFYPIFQTRLYNFYRWYPCCRINCFKAFIIVLDFMLFSIFFTKMA